MKTIVDGIDVLTKAISSSGISCPLHGDTVNTALLSTTNQWDRYCRKCDIRYNQKGEIQDPKTYEKVRSENVKQA